eukprot:13283-Heterococcus_DN1.PRE.1
MQVDHSKQCIAACAYDNRCAHDCSQSALSWLYTQCCNAKHDGNTLDSVLIALRCAHCKNKTTC